MGYIHNLGIGFFLLFSSVVAGTFGYFHLFQHSAASPSQATTTTTTATSSTSTTTFHDSSPRPSSDCLSATPVIDLEGNPSAAVESTTHIYGEYCTLLAGAEPGAFIALDYYYGKSPDGVWLLADPIEDGPVNAMQIIAADPSTFTLIPEPNPPTPSEPFSAIYTKDKNHVYANGQILEDADPNKFVVTPGSTTVPSDDFPCLTDAHDASHFYFDGIEVNNNFCEGEQ